VVKDQFSQRNSETMGLAKSRIRQGLIKKLAKGRDQKNEALIPNETNKVRHAQIIQNIWNIVIKSIWTNIYVIRMNSKIYDDYN
jgi:hypothetical protein